MEVRKEGIVNTNTGISLYISPNELQLGQVIGHGSSGVVYAARHVPTGTLIALKVTARQAINIYERERRKQMANDLKALDEITCPYFVKYFGAYFEEGVVKIAMELMDVGSIRRIVKAIEGRPEPTVPEPILHYIALATLQALHYIHRVKHMMHRDIKPDNILVNSAGEIKVSDFGVSKELGSTAALCNTFVGTFAYMSPERIEKNNYSFPGDIWSVGILLIELARGVYPYPSTRTIIEVLENLRNLPAPSLPRNGMYSLYFCDFIDRW